MNSGIILFIGTCTCIFKILFILIHAYILGQKGGVKCDRGKEEYSKPKVQNLILENRERLSISGVIDVESFNDECGCCRYELGVLVSQGNGSAYQQVEY